MDNNSQMAGGQQEESIMGLINTGQNNVANSDAKS